MNFFKPKDTPATAAPPPSPPHHHHHNPLHQAFTSLQTHFSNFVRSIQTNPPLKCPLFATISNENNPFHSNTKSDANSRSNSENRAMLPETIEERLAGVPVFALSNGSREFVLLSGGSDGRSLGLFCFSKDDAEALLEQMKSVDPYGSSDSQVVAVDLSKVLQLKVDGVAIRLMPEASQVMNALYDTNMDSKGFVGVPVFQSRSLVLRSRDKKYRPAFFRKEDLDNSLLRASSDQGVLNPTLRQGDLKVAVLEDIIQGIKDSKMSSWEDVIFIPPGFDVSTHPSSEYS